MALGVQFAGFEAAVLLLSCWFELPSAAIAGTLAVIVSVIGSVFMLTTSAVIRQENVPSAYRQLLFGSRMEIVFGLLAFILLLVYVFVYDPRQIGKGLLVSILGERPPIVFVIVFLLLGWDVAYRIGVGWWASLVGL